MPLASYYPFILFYEDAIHRLTIKLSSPLNKVSLLQKEYVEEGQTEIQSEF